MAELSPAEWFDQFPPQPQMTGNAQWCGRHWAPCPLLCADGMQAAMLVLDLFVNRVLIPAGISPRDFSAANARLAEAGKLCCWAGDAEMYAIWAKCPPSFFRSQSLN
jgi:hypothetical protein